MAEVKNEKGNQEWRFSQEQYEMLLRCSKKKDMKEWNEWRKHNLGEVILLEGADFLGANLSYVELSDYGGIASPPQVCLRGASFLSANLEHGRFVGADLRDVDLTGADLIDVMLSGARLENATLKGARLNGRYGMQNFYFRGTCFDGAQIQCADLRRAIADSSTSFWECVLDRDTDFREVALASVQLEQGKKELLRYNIRRKNWEDWYNEHKRQKWFVRPFWWMSDYGRSISRIMLTFFLLALVFALVYYFVPNLVKDLHVTGHWYSDLIRSCYFSVVTMTTLGFGDMFANEESIAGHVLLMFQVILGYVLLGALVTRFAVLFTAGGPAGTFADGKKRTPKT